MRARRSTGPSRPRSTALRRPSSSSMPSRRTDKIENRRFYVGFSFFAGQIKRHSSFSCIMHGQGGIFMQNWHDNVLRLIAEIDRCIRAHDGETLTLAHLARLLDCSQSQVSHKFATTRASVTGILCKSSPAFPERIWRRSAPFCGSLPPKPSSRWRS